MTKFKRVLTLCDPMDYTVHGIFQARILEWVGIPFSRGSSQTRDRTQVSRIAGGFLPAEPPGKFKNTGVGSYHFSLPRNRTRILKPPQYCLPFVSRPFHSKANNSWDSKLKGIPKKGNGGFPSNPI